MTQSRTENEFYEMALDVITDPQSGPQYGIQGVIQEAPKTASPLIVPGQGDQ